MNRLGTTLRGKSGTVRDPAERQAETARLLAEKLDQRPSELRKERLSLAAEKEALKDAGFWQKTKEFLAALAAATLERVGRRKETQIVDLGPEVSLKISAETQSQGEENLPAAPLPSLQQHRPAKVAPAIKEQETVEAIGDSATRNALFKEGGEQKLGRATTLFGKGINIAAQMAASLQRVARTAYERTLAAGAKIADHITSAPPTISTDDLA